jgi:hypothetical protein
MTANWSLRSAASSVWQRLGGWAIAALAALVAWFSLSAYLRLTHLASRSALATALWVTAAWAAIFAAAVAVSQRKTGRAQALLLLIASLLLVGPVVLFSLLFWIPDLLAGWCSAWGLTYGRALVISWLTAGAVGLGCWRLVSRRKNASNGRGGSRL